MFARLVRFSLASGSEAKAQELADELTPDDLRPTRLSGGHDIRRPQRWRAWDLRLWDMQEHADAAAGLVRPQPSTSIWRKRDGAATAETVRGSRIGVDATVWRFEFVPEASCYNVAQTGFLDKTPPPGERGQRRHARPEREEIEPLGHPSVKIGTGTEVAMKGHA